MDKLQYIKLLKKMNIIYEDKKFFRKAMNYKNIDKILIANRGEIACRIIKTAKKLGINTVSVYSEVDKHCKHVELADEAYYIGPAPSIQSYLRQDKIITVAKKSKCKAIHPGYGFLSENAEFAELCEKQNIIFIGPPSSCIRDMGIKSKSKILMTKAGIRTVEGYHGNDQSNEILLIEAQKINFPLIIKAVRGAGGKGMRTVWNETEFVEALESARLESYKAFGDSSILLEKYIAQPRHIEVQIFADTHGNVVSLFERDCSIQRRHQKIMEEAPAPGISEEIRLELGKTAIRVAKTVGYVGAGTVEFIMDKYTHKFYFMEMNTRLQVEHPVTEMITGIDLVDWQIKIANGEKLPLSQENIHLNGHALEARVYAENPREEFLPSTGKLLHFDVPLMDKNSRIETGVRKNDDVSMHYDPMIAKVVIWGKDRTETLNIMRLKLSKYNIAGLETNIEFIQNICKNQKFRCGDIHTGFITENYESLFTEIHVPSDIISAAALGLILYEEINSLKCSIHTSDPFNPFLIESGIRLNHFLNRQFNFEVDKKKFLVDVQYFESDIYYMRINDLGPWKKVSGSLKKQKNRLLLKSNIDGTIQKISIFKTGNHLHLFTHDKKWLFAIPVSKYVKKITNYSNISSDAVISPMPGTVDRLLVKEGACVKAGDSLLVIVAMKMEYSIKARSNGIVEMILCKVGENITKNKLLIKLKNNSIINVD